MAELKDLKKIDIKWSKILKILGVIVLGIIVLSLLINLVISPLFMGTRTMMSPSYSKSVSSQAYPMDSYDGGMMDISLRNVAYEKGINESVIMGDDAEAFEVTEYSATIETGNLERDCSLISALKARDYVIFEGSNMNDRSCNYTFKAKKENLEEVLGIIENMNPRDLSENVQSIKRQIDDYTSQEEILKNKQNSIDETLKNAVTAYDEITALATKANDVESLAKVIDSKISIIERLTQERINISAELERLARAKAEQLDRLKYVYFYINIYENKIVDPQYLKDSWINSAKQFVMDMNNILEDLSIRLITLFFSTIRYLVYLFVILIVVKYCWRLGKYIWKK